MTTIKGDIELQRTLAKIADKAPQATVYALNGLAFDARKEVQSQIPQWVRLTRNFLPNSVVVTKASTSYPAATVGFDKRANFATLLEDGGTRTPKNRALAIPVDVKTTQKGGISNANRPQALRGKAGVFSGVVNGVAGIWQSTKRIPMRLLYAFAKKATYNHKLLRFRITVDKVFKSRYEQKFKEAINRVLLK